MYTTLKMNLQTDKNPRTFKDHREDEWSNQTCIGWKKATFIFNVTRSTYRGGWKLFHKAKSWIILHILMLFFPHSSSMQGKLHSFIVHFSQIRCNFLSRNSHKGDLGVINSIIRRTRMRIAVALSWMHCHWQQFGWCYQVWYLHLKREIWKPKYWKVWKVRILDTDMLGNCGEADHDCLVGRERKTKKKKLCSML